MDRKFDWNDSTSSTKSSEGQQGISFNDVEKMSEHIKREPSKSRDKRKSTNNAIESNLS